jgi:hypothetical protein
MVPSMWIELQLDNLYQRAQLKILLKNIPIARLSKESLASNQKGEVVKEGWRA